MLFSDHNIEQHIQPCLKLADEVDDGAVAELVLVVAAVGDHLLLPDRAQRHLGQDGHPVFVCLAQQRVKQYLENITQRDQLTLCKVILCL